MRRKFSIAVLVVFFIFQPIFYLDLHSQPFIKNVWEKNYDVNSNCAIKSVIRATDGSFLLAGEAVSKDVNRTRLMVMKIDVNGTLLWQKFFGSAGDFNFVSIAKSRLEGFYLLGTKLDAGRKSVWLTKIDANGTLLWETSTIIGEKDKIADLCESIDYGVFICGSKEIKGDRDTDAWLLKYNRKGVQESQALFGTRFINDAFNTITENDEGGLILSGFTSSQIGDLPVPFYISTDKKGTRLWEKKFVDIKGSVPVYTTLNSSKDRIVTLADAGQGNVMKIILTLSGELERTYQANLKLSLTKGTIAYSPNGSLIMIPDFSGGQSIGSLTRLDEKLNPVWITPQNHTSVSTKCITGSGNDQFLSAWISTSSDKQICHVVLAQDESEKQVNQYMNEKLILAGMRSDETIESYRTRIGDEEFSNKASQIRSDASRDLSLLPDMYSRNSDAPSDSRPSIIAYSKNDTKTEKEVALKGNYYALLIAINEYKDPSVTNLEKPINDAQKLFQVLVDEYLFEKSKITFLKNPTREQIISALDRLEREITRNDNLLIFYAGHGYWNETNQKGFWLASDASKENTANWIANSSISDYIRSIPAKHTLLIADACFSGSIFKTRAAFGNLDKSAQKLYELTSRKAMTSGTLTEVPDKSVFVEYLIKRLKDNQEPYLSSEQLFFSFKPAVLNNTENIPQFGVVGNTGDEGGDFLFIKKKDTDIKFK
jgi:hypothetical protein